MRSPGAVFVPGDISSAAFFIVLAMLMPGSSLLLKDVSLNPTRTGILDVLERMGGRLKIKKSRLRLRSAEPMGNILAKSSVLKGVKVTQAQIPSLIDELPVLMVAACFARGTTVLEGIQELRVKETDRINSMVTNLSAMGADIRVVRTGKAENIVIRPADALRPARFGSFGDHRTAMSMVVAGLAAGKGAVVEDVSCIKKSFPTFFTVLKQILKRS